MDKAAFLDFGIEVVRRVEGTTGFHVLPRRWDYPDGSAIRRIGGGRG